jgi:hypothetical protein
MLVGLMLYAFVNKMKSIEYILLSYLIIGRLLIGSPLDITMANLASSSSCLVLKKNTSSSARAHRQHFLLASLPGTCSIKPFRTLLASLAVAPYASKKDARTLNMDKQRKESKTRVEKECKNIQQLGFAGGHPPNY